MLMSKSASTQSIKNVLEQYFEFSVAPYQRTYSWGADEISEFFDDVKDSAESGNGHFFGTLILQVNEEDATRAEVVDGQQRLTTLFIFLAALRDQIAQIGLHQIPAETSHGKPIQIQDKLWRMIYSNEDDFKDIRFQSNPVLRKLMLESVLCEPSKDRPKLPAQDIKMTLAFRKGVRTIRNLIEEDLNKVAAEVNEDLIPITKVRRINALFNTVTELFRVLQVPTQSRNESLEVFLTLNDRGVPLGPSDLVRTQIMHIIGESENEKNQNKLHSKLLDEWKNVVELVGEPETFLRHFLISRQKQKVQKKKVVEFVQNEFDEHKGSKRSAAQAFWLDLLGASEAYGKIVDSPYGVSKDPDFNSDWAYYAHLLEGVAKSHRIALLPAVQLRPEEKAARKSFQPQMDEYFRLVFVLQFRWVANGGNAQKLEDFFQTCTNSIRETGTLDESIALILNKIDETDPDIEKLLRDEGDSNFICKALLHAVNRSLVLGQNPIPLNKSIHLEHVAPNSVNDEWLTYLFSGDQNRFGEYDELRSQIGNLTLLDEKLNKDAQRKAFDIKCAEHYEKSSVFMTTKLKELTVWNPEVIEARNQWLIEMFDLIWSKENQAKNVVPFKDWAMSNNFGKHFN